jgi:hypothetical protein
LRKDVFLEEVLTKCDVLKTCGVWSNEPKIRPRAWLSNFDPEDKEIAALLLDRFIYYSDEHTNSLLLSSYHSLGSTNNIGLVQQLPNAKFTLVTGEVPNPTDSGYVMCRKVRQILHVPDEKIVSPEEAAKHAQAGGVVIFLDDFIGSGDQFLTTWDRKYLNGQLSFRDIMQNKAFLCAYVTLVTTDFGLGNIADRAPEVFVSAAHTITDKSTIKGIDLKGVSKQQLDVFLEKYARRLTPQDDYIANNPIYKKYGYKQRGLLLGFEHSIPDATLPIFWSVGKNGWIPLVERC